MNPSPFQHAAGNQTYPHRYAAETLSSPAADQRNDSNVLENEEAALASQPDSSVQLRSEAAQAESRPVQDSHNKLAQELKQFTAVANQLRATLEPAPNFEQRCRQAFDVANDLFTNAPTWVCFYRELMGGSGMLHILFDNNKEFGAFLRTDQHHQIQSMLTALRSRDLPENDPNDPQRMITVRLPKSLHEAMCEEAGRLNISVNRLCISRMLQLLDPEMIPETHSKPRGRKPRTRTNKPAVTTPSAIAVSHISAPGPT
jgi:predicted HicB family RNase H-like nuclease